MKGKLMFLKPRPASAPLTNQKIQKIKTFLEHEPELFRRFKQSILPLAPPSVDAIAVTYGPGLEPALWTGINFAKALGALWDKPILGINHMEGHIVAALLNTNIKSPRLRQTKRGRKKSNIAGKNKKAQSTNITFPALALLVSGGHTELVLIKKWLDYKVIGETRDDAAGEVFDKVARMLQLGYPGGPEIARVARKGNKNAIPFPRPMIHSQSLDFSFSGLKTAVLYYLRDHPAYNKNDVAASFQESVIETLIAKTARAVKTHKAASLILGGGVAANAELRKQLFYKRKAMHKGLRLFLPKKQLTTDNAAMIGAAAYFYALKKKFANPQQLHAQGNLRL